MFRHRIATASKPNNCANYIVQFRHPCLKQGNVHLKVRKSLQTSDREEAENLANQLTELLNTPALWDMNKWQIVKQRYGRLIADIFFSPMTNRMFCTHCGLSELECTCKVPNLVNQHSFKQLFVEELKQDILEGESKEDIIRRIDILKDL